MKRFLNYNISFFLLALAMSSCSSNDDNEIKTLIDYDSLPSISQKFIEEYFGGQENVAKIEKDTDQNIVIYEVETKDGYELVFNTMGYWQEVDAPSGKTIPVSFLPEPIQQQLSYQYHGYGVVEVNTTGENYHLVLSNNQGGESIELLFNQSGEIIDTGNSPV